MSYSLSFIMPSIRINKIEATYKSIKKSFSGKWELIVIGPYEPPALENIVWVKDFGNLTRCRQLGLINSSYDLVTWTTDDCVYLSGAIDEALKLYAPKRIVSMIITEGDNWNPEALRPRHYLACSHEDLFLPFLPMGTVLLNYAIVAKQDLLDIGGWDCRFEQMGEADVDLSVRLCKNGILGLITDFQCVKVEHMPGTSGDHAPVHYAHFENDLPLLQSIYRNESALKRIKIDLDNWKNASEKWERRFGK